MPTARPSPLTTSRLLRARARSRTGLLVAMSASIAAAVATVTALGLWIVQAIADAPATRPPGLGDESFDAQVDDGVAALVAATPGLILLVLLLAGVAAAQLGRLVATARAQETSAVRARGLSRAQARTTDAVEAAFVSLAGAIAGLVLSAALFALVGLVRGGRGLGVVLARGEVGLVVGAAAGVAIVLGAVGMLAAGRRERAGERAGRAARATTVVVIVVVLAAAAFAVWQLHVVRDRPGAFDPVVAAAPAVVLLAAAIVVLAVFAPLSAATAAATGRGAGLAPALPARQVARRVGVYAVAVLLISFTAAQAVFAASYASTWTSLVSASTAVQTGTDLRVDFGTTDATPELVATVAGVDGVTDAAAALVVPVEAGANAFELIAVPTPDIAAVVAPVAGAVDPAGIAADVGFTSAAVHLGDDATGLEIRAEVTTPFPTGADAVQLSAWVTDATGTTTRIRFDATSEPEVDGIDPLAGTAALPAGTGPWRLVAITAGLRGGVVLGDTTTVALTAVRATGGVAVDAAGSVDLNFDTSEAQLWLADPVPEGEDAPAVPVVVSSALATRAGLAEGDVLDIRYSGSGREGALRIAGITPSIPGASEPLAAFAALDGLQASMLQQSSSLVTANSVWAAGDPDAASAVSAATGDRIVSTSAPGVSAVIAGALVPAWWIATAGAVVLALIAAAAISRTLSSGRMAELAVLRAAGIRARAQARMRSAELAGAAGFALVAGSAAGALAAWVAATELAGAAAPGIRALAPVGVSFAWPPLVIALFALLLGLAAVVAVAAGGVRRAAREAVVTESAR